MGACCGQLHQKKKEAKNYATSTSLPPPSLSLTNGRRSLGGKKRAGCGW
jgi:hypothetical protein